MMGTLSLFPVRVPIGQWTDDAQNSYDVLMTPEFARALSDLFARVGGANGVNTDDLERLVALSEIVPVVTAQEASQIQQQDDFGVTAAAVASIAGKLSELEAKLEAVESTNARLAKLEAMLQDAQVEESYRDPFRVDWERPGKIGALTPNSGAFTTLSATGQITSTLATGTAPLVIASTTKVANLNVDLLDGADWASPLAIGTTTPNSGKFTSLETTISAGGASSKAWVLTASAAYAIGLGPTSTEGYMEYHSGTGSTAVFGHRWYVNGIERLKADGTGLTTATGTLKVTGGFGCNTKNPQTAFASGGAVAATAATNVTPFGYTTAAQADGIVTLVNNIRTALINNGIMS